MRAYFTLIGWLALSACSEAPPLVLPAGDEGTGGAGGSVQSHILSVSDNSTVESDPQIAVSNEGLIYLVYSGRLGYAPTHIGYVVSKDRGITWSEPFSLKSDLGESYRSPDVISDNFGNFYLSFLAYARNGTGASIQVARAESGGAFGSPFRVTEEDEVGFYRRPQLAINNASRLLVGYTTLVGGVSQLAIATSKDGEKWTNRVLTEGNTHHHHASPCAAYLTPQGYTYLTSVNQGALTLRRSGDNGETWEAIGVQATAENGKISGAPLCVASAKNVWVVYGTRKTGGLKEVRVARSADSGASVTSWLTLSNPEESALFAVPQLTVEAPDIGHALFYAGAGPGDESASLRRVRFTNEDLVTPPEEPPDEPELPTYISSTLVHEPLTLQLNDENDRWLGDRVGIAFDKDQLYVSYVDNALRHAHVAFEVLTP